MNFCTAKYFSRADRVMNNIENYSSGYKYFFFTSFRLTVNSLQRVGYNLPVEDCMYRLTVEACKK
jgi:hypothetical protein